MGIMWKDSDTMHLNTLMRGGVMYTTIAPKCECACIKLANA